MPHLLIVDDEQSICWGLAKLAEQLGHTAATAVSAEQGLAAAGTARPDVIMLDVRLPGMDGLAAMQHFQEAAPGVPIVVMTAYGELSTAVTAVRNGAFDYLAKPFDLAVAQRAIESALKHNARPTDAPIRLPPKDPAGLIVGASPPMQEVFKRIALVAPSDACVHVRGESGTGKEMVARAIHRYSRRAAGPFVAVNMASLSPTLAESELFGHVRGAFTGAEQSRKGLLEQAGGGTIFLDEVADIPMALQVKLLRVLEFGEIVPVGGDHAVRSDFRMISATHQNLQQRVAEGKFRHDLYFRLITFEIELPPLRQRREDIGPLAEHFLDVLADRNPGPRPSISPGGPGGVAAAGLVRQRPRASQRHRTCHDPRPRRHHRAASICRRPCCRPAWEASGRKRPSPCSSAPGPRPSWKARRKSRISTSGCSAWSNRRCLKAALQHAGGQCLAASRRLGLHRTTLRKKLDELGIGGED